MPRGDGTGPKGMGPMTGRAAGYCAGFDMPGFVNPVSGRNIGVGRGHNIGFGGGGRGRRNMFYATGQPGWMRGGNAIESEPIAEKQALQRQMDILQAQLEAINKRLATIEAE